jgi:hypothetical protein
MPEPSTIISCKLAINGAFAAQVESAQFRVGFLPLCLQQIRTLVCVLSVCSIFSRIELTMLENPLTGGALLVCEMRKVTMLQLREP